MVTYMQIIKIPRALFSMVSVVMAMVFSLFMSSYVGLFLLKELEIDKTIFAYYIALWATFYTISTLLIGPISKKISATKITLASYLLIALGSFLFGPSAIFGLETWSQDQITCNTTDARCRESMKFGADIFCDDVMKVCQRHIIDEKISILIYSLIVLGTASGSVTVPIMLEFVAAIKEEIGARPGANEKGTALFMMCGAVGSIIATLLGSYLYRTLGNETTADVFGCLSLLMAVIFFLCNIWPGFLKKKTPPATQAPAE